MTWERARKPEQKAVRRDAILGAARALFAELPYEEISLNAIAREAGISKPNVYRYFATREEIFLTIFKTEQEQFIHALIGALQQVRPTEPVIGISQAWVDTLLAHQNLLDLIPQLSTSMERNSSVEQLVVFKQAGYAQFADLVSAHADICPGLRQEQWVMVIQCAYSMVAGLWPFANPGENVIAALQHPDVNQCPWEFEPAMLYGLSALIQGAITMNAAPTAGTTSE